MCPAGMAVEGLESAVLACLRAHAALWLVIQKDPKHAGLMDHCDDSDH